MNSYKTGVKIVWTLTDAIYAIERMGWHEYYRCVIDCVSVKEPDRFMAEVYKRRPDLYQSKLNNE